MGILDGGYRPCGTAGSGEKSLSFELNEIQPTFADGED
jgi:hypothetical protein